MKFSTMTNSILIIMLIILILNLFSCVDQKEGFFGGTKCPTQLYQQNGEFILIHEGKKAKFANLEEYKYFVEAMRMRGVRCPVLYVEPVHDAQGGLSMKHLDDPITPTTGLMQLPANYVVKGTNGLYADRDPLASTQFPLGFDPQNQDQGGDYPIDRLFSVQSDPEWMNPDWVRGKIQAGEMYGDEVLVRK